MIEENLRISMTMGLSYTFPHYLSVRTSEESPCCQYAFQIPTAYKGISPEGKDCMVLWYKHSVRNSLRYDHIKRVLSWPNRFFTRHGTRFPH